MIFACLVNKENGKKTSMMLGLEDAGGGGGSIVRVDLEDTKGGPSLRALRRTTQMGWQWSLRVC